MYFSVSDERLNGQIELLGGDGSYGEVGFFYSGLWRKVCYQGRRSSRNVKALASDICSQLGYK